MLTTSFSHTPTTCGGMYSKLPMVLTSLLLYSYNLSAWTTLIVMWCSSPHFNTLLQLEEMGLESCERCWPPRFHILLQLRTSSSQSNQGCLPPRFHTLLQLEEIGLESCESCWPPRFHILLQLSSSEGTCPSWVLTTSFSHTLTTLVAFLSITDPVLTTSFLHTLTTLDIKTTLQVVFNTCNFNIFKYSK